MKSSPAKPKPKLTREQALVLQILTAEARGKHQYATKGAKETELRALCPAGTGIIMPDGRRYCFVDTFANRDVVFKNVGVDRYKLELMKS